MMFGNVLSVSAQKERSQIRSGNKLYERGDYVGAEVDYLRALEFAPKSLEARFNLAAAQYKQERYDDAEKVLQELAQDTLNMDYRADIQYNLGNVFMKQRKFQEAVEAYKNSLRVNPSDMDAKFNLAYAQKMLEKDQQNQNQQNNQNNQNNDQNKDQNDQNKDQNDQNKDQNDQNKDQNDQNKDQNDQNKDQNDQNKDQNDQNKDQNDQNKDQNDQNKDQNDQNKDQNDRNQGEGNNPNQNEMTRDEAEKLLQAIQNNEDNTRKKVNAQKAKGGAVSSGKNW